MITIFKNKNDIPQEVEYVELNDIYFNQNTARKLDERAKKIIGIIDEAKLIGKYKICSKFNDIVLDVDKLSAGCKTVLNVLYNPDKVFCLKECGNNALEVLYNLDAGNVYSDYAIIPFEMAAVSVQTSSGKKKICGYEELKEWWCYEE
ncbi:MAG: DUF4869 domain-containing protein [Candidatus Gastranaerophilales bacterium]|nr:DUF4869 domain-containing protein [Candidatus Gastranaerophilales bacterium]